MQIAAETTPSPSLLSAALSEFSGSPRQSPSFPQQAIRRSGAIAGFSRFKTSLAALMHATLHSPMPTQGSL
jgi:hypothetical protein